MAQVYPNISRQKIMEGFLNTTLSLRLYSNNLTPAVTDTIGSFTEMSGGGYAAKSLTFGGWAVTLANPAVCSRITPSTWTFNAPAGNVYGYYLIRTSDSLLVVAERFPTAPVVVVNGTVITITLTLNLRGV